MKVSKPKFKSGREAKANPDSQIKEMSAHFDQELHEKAVKHRMPDRLVDESTGEARPNFPAKLTAYDPEDDYIERKINADQSAFGAKFLERSDLEWLKRKEQNAQWAEFMNYIETYFDLRDPAIAAWAEKVIPDYYSRRQAEIDEQCELQRQIAHLRLRGPRSQEDLLLTYALTSGKLEPPQAAVWDHEHWYGDEGAYNNAFARGIFNPRRYTSAPRRPHGKIQRFDPMRFETAAAGPAGRPGLFGTNFQGQRADQVAQNLLGGNPTIGDIRRRTPNQA